MTQSTPQPPEHPADAGGTKAVPVDAPARRGRLGRLTRQGRTRWVALGLVVLVGGGAAAAVAVAEHRHEAHEGHPAFAGGHGRGDGPKGGRAHGGPQAFGRQDGEDGEDGGPGRFRPGREFSGGAGARAAAPAQLPALPAGQAADKAAGAVSGGKVESLRVVVEQGGASAWEAVVLGPDGVRHDVTLSGSDGTVTGNTVLDKGPKAPR
ncbi:hypothetical protein [Streptomyces sp. NPDC054838]